MDKLLPCPMCGKPAATDDAGVHCSDVGCGLHLVKDCTAEQWNTRHTPEGWQLVPSRVTPKWRAAMQKRGVRTGSIKNMVEDALAAAPKRGGE